MHRFFRINLLHDVVVFDILSTIMFVPVLCQCNAFCLQCVSVTVTASVTPTSRRASPVTTTPLDRSVSTVAAVTMATPATAITAQVLVVL